MGYVFLWLEAMASALLLVAVVFSLTGRFKKWPALWPVLMTVVLALAAILATIATGFLFHLNVHPQWLFPYFLSWTLLFIFGSWMVVRRGRKKAGPTPSAASWSRSKLAGALLIAFVLQWFTMDILDNAAKLEAVAAQTKALNRVQTLLPAPPPHDQNAAELYEQAAQELGDAPDWLKKEAADPAFDPKSDKVQNLLREKKGALALFKEAAQKPDYYQPLSFNFTLEPITPLRNAARLLGLEARTYALNGQMAAALENITTINKIAGHLEQTPHLINVLIAGMIRTESKQTLEMILANRPDRSNVKTPFPVKPHDHIAQAFRHSLTFSDAQQIFDVADILIHRPSTNILSQYRISGSLEPKSAPAYFTFNKLYRIFFYHDDVVGHERYWNKVHEFTQKPSYESRLELKKLENDRAKSPGYGLVTSIAIPRISYYFDRVARSQTQILLAQLALATTAYRSDHGKYPTTLNALAPKYIAEIPTDPFSGDPLKMKAAKGGLILYSVGQDLKDDGGTAFDSETKEGDIAFYLGSAYTKHRLKPALEKKRKKMEKVRNKKKKDKE